MRAEDITTLLVAWSRGDQSALDRLIPLVHGSLRAIAQNLLKNESPGHMWRATELAHEAYLRLAGNEPVACRERAHFFAVAARTMRHLLVEHARARLADKREGAWRRITLGDINQVSIERPKELTDLDDALELLSRRDERMSRIVEMKFFGGMNFDDIAEVLGVSVVTAKREWALAKAWLFDQLKK